MVAATSASPLQQHSRLGWLTDNTLTGMVQRRKLLAYLFLLPTMIGIFVFTAGPVFISLGLSVFSWNVFDPPEYVGAENFQRLFSDRQAIVGIQHTLQTVVMAVSLQLILALFLALGVQKKMHWLARYFFRTAYFLPLLMSGVAVAIVFGYLFHREFGVVNYYLAFLGVKAIPWLNSKDWVMTTIVITAVWRNIGFTFIIFLGGLGNISKEVLDAADVDGAHGWARLRHVILPLLSPTILFAMVTAVIQYLQVFEEPYIMTRGGPGDASRTAVMVMYEAAFKNIELGYGAAMAVVLFILIMVVTVGQFVMSKRFVFYQ